ncbi:protein kinase [Myxococcus stipitatus]|uniref:protein kinase domain-containing protein n=1 Tax=Myxococcus stipitatus TaxID=83455 RepID=UPI0031455F01
MSEQDEVELRHALAEGLLSREECDALRSEAARLGRRPLELLKERGRLSEDTHASLLRLMLREEDTRSPVAPVTVDTGRHAPGRDATLSLEKGLAPVSPPPPVEVPAFPVSDWEHYSPIRFLGQGGMGRVFLARDNRLHRQVALKFVRGDEPELARRFILEARAQARVTHPRVCEVYEVGEVQGRAYIAMRYVEGRPLHALVETLSVEQKARVLREAAEGVHAAHRAGLIHRDIKPSNILVEQTAEGALSPFVMDFGLARDWKEGVTATGTVLGTPHYMSPEQARGEVARLDRRADVYSLGATLYALLTGTPPIPGQNGLEVLGNIGTVEPRPPRALDRDIPVDLEAITLKCLEKDRSARYGSARELAEDLGRFLDGEPVLARTGPGYRARKWLRKHRRAVAVGTGALVVVSLAVGQSVLARGEVSQREALARRFTEQVERIEAQARYSGTSPPHDTRRDREALGARMRELETAMRDAGPMGVASGHYALGRGYLALDDDARAREHLEAAWKAGATEPRVAYSLALALAHLYQQARLEAERQQDAATREARLREATQRYGAPARDFLRKSEGAEVPAPEYVAALLAFLENRPEEALAKLDALGSRLPWFHEAPLLRGDTLLLRGSSRWNTGSREGALSDFDEARRAYAHAADIGRSVPAVYRALAQLEGWALLVALYGQGDVPLHHARGVEAASKALALAPDDAEAHSLLAGFHRRLAEHQSRQGSDVEPVLEKALVSARRAVELRPDLPKVLHELAVVHWQRARFRQEKGMDPRDSLREAAAAFERIPAEARDYEFHADVGQVFRVWADHEEGGGGDSLPYREKAIAAHERAVAINALRPEAWINLGTEYLARASHPRAVDPSGDLDKAAAALERAQSINPAHIAPWFYAGEVHLARAARHRDTGVDPKPALASALTAYEKGVAINPKLPPLHNGLGTVWFERAKDAWERGEDVEPALREALKAFDGAIALAPAQGYGQNNVGEVHAWRATMRVLEGQSPAGEVLAARSALKDALARIPDLPQPWMNLGTALQAEAAWALRQGHPPGPALEEALTSLRRALELNPKQAQAWRVLGDALAVQARAKAREEDFTEAEQAFLRAVELEPSQPEHLVALGRFCLERGLAPGGRPVLERGLSHVDKALSLRAEWPRARALRAGLALALAASASASEAGRGESEPERQARALLSRALDDNRHLLKEWGRWLTASSGAAAVSR